MRVRPLKCPTKKKKIKIQHRASNNFCSCYANGAIISGPLPNGLLNIVFYEDALAVNSETGIPQDTEGHFIPTLEEDDFYNFREDVARISMSMATAKDIYKLLKPRFEPDSESEKAESKDSKGEEK